MKNRLFNKNIRIAAAILIVIGGITGTFCKANAAVFPERFGNQLSGIAKGIYDALTSYYYSEDAVGDHKITLTAPVTFSAQFNSAGEMIENDSYRNADSQLGIAIQSAADAFSYDYPEVFWVNYWMNTYSIDISDGKGTISSVLFKPTELTAGIASKKGQYTANLNSAITKIKSKLSSGDNRYQTVLAIHDYVCSSYSYGIGDNPLLYSSAGAFSGSGLMACEGYAKTFKVLCDQFGIPCVCVNGIAETNTGEYKDHMWNYVQMEDKAWYLVDTTWDDQESGMLHTYFLAGTASKGFQKVLSAERFPNGDLSKSKAFVFTYPVLSTIGYSNKSVDKTADPIIDSSVDPTYAEVHSSFSTYCSEDGNNKTFTGNFGYYYKDSYFSGDSTDYNHSLATMSLCLAFSTYGYVDYNIYDANVKKILSECGFCQNGAYEQYHFNEKPASNSIGCVIGSKKIDQNTTLIAVAVRSGGYEAEWASNLTVQTSGDHAGFDTAANQILSDIKAYVKKHKNDLKGTIKLWITGFSRGGAVATQTAAKLNDTTIDGLAFKKKNIFAYGFASPAGALWSNNPHAEKYNNIFHVIDFNDPVPMVAPEIWGFDRYGTTKVFPFDAGVTGAQKYIDNVKSYMKKMSCAYKLDDFRYPGVGAEPILNEMFVTGDMVFTNRQDLGIFNHQLISTIAYGIGNRNSYKTFFQDRLCSLLGITEGLSRNQYAALSFSDTILGLMSTLTLHPVITTTAIKNRDLLAAAHAQQEYYVAWMQSMDANYKKVGNYRPVKWGMNNYRTVVVNCPVDVFVYTSSGELAASIIDEKPGAFNEYGIIAMVDENAQKVVYLPVDSEYSVQVKPREACDLTINVNEYSTVSGNATRVSNYSSVHVEKTDVLVAGIAEYSENDLGKEDLEGSHTDYTLKKGNTEIVPSKELTGSENIIVHTYDVSAKYDKTKVEVIGTGAYTEGAFAMISAIPKNGYIIEGFYVNGEKLTNSQNDLAVRFEVKGNTAVEIKVVAAYVKPGTNLVDSKTGNIYKVTSKSKEVQYFGTTSGKKSATIPATVTINGATYKITAIADNAFKKNTTITSVDIGKNVKKIGKSAFQGCTKLKTVKGCKGITSIGANAFSGDKKLTSIAMGTKLTAIGDKAFYKCSALTKITIPAKVVKIGKSAFQGCKKLKTITIKTAKLTSKKVGAKAFTGTASNATIKVPKKSLKAYKQWLVKKGAGKKVKIKG